MNKAAIFDLDGTLIDSVGDIALCCNTALEIAGLPQHDPEEYRNFIGWGVDVLISKAIGPQGDKAFHQKVLDDYSTIYGDICSGGCKMFPGIPEMLRSLRAHGILTAVVSNKPQAQTEAVYLSTLSGLVDAWYGQHPGWPTKPDPCGVRYVLEQLGPHVRPIAYVGDSEVDVATGRGAGIPTVGVSWGMKSRGFLLDSGAGEVADTVEELEKILLQKA